MTLAAPRNQARVLVPQDALSKAEVSDVQNPTHYGAPASHPYAMVSWAPLSATESLGLGLAPLVVPLQANVELQCEISPVRDFGAHMTRGDMGKFGCRPPASFQQSGAPSGANSSVAVRTRTRGSQG